MAEHLPNITVTGDEFISVNAVSGIAVGTAFWMQNKGFYLTHLIESATKPANDSDEGLVIGNIHSNISDPKVAAGSLEIWVRCQHVGKSNSLFVEAL